MLQKLVGFAGKPSSEIRLNTKAFVEQFIEHRVKVIKKSDIDLCQELKNVSKLTDPDERLKWILDRRKEFKLKKAVAVVGAAKV